MTGKRRSGLGSRNELLFVRAVWEEQETYVRWWLKERKKLAECQFKQKSIH